MTGAQWKRSAEERLRRADDPDAQWDARLFLSAVLNVELDRLALAQMRVLTAEQTETLEEMLARRSSGEPEQYIEGRTWFMGLPFQVDPRVLIPRQDTETLCEFALEELKHVKAPRVLDLCTGSGALAVSIAYSRPDSRVTASDISADALAVAADNARRNGAEIETVLSDGFSALDGRRFDYVVCNPPYLTKTDMEQLQTEVRAEPPLALYGGEDGLDLYRRFAGELPPHLNEGGGAAFEVGQGQARDVLEILRKSFPSAETGCVKDLNGTERVVYLRTK